MSGARRAPRPHSSSRIPNVVGIKRTLVGLLPRSAEAAARSAFAWYLDRRRRLGVHRGVLALQPAAARARYVVAALLGRGAVLRAPEAAVLLHARLATSDPHVFHQIFVEREYAAVADLRDVRLVVDCGANVGYASAWFASRFPDARIVAVEPDPANVAECRRNLAPFGDRVVVHESGVWSHPAGLCLTRPHHRDGDAWAVQVREAEPGETPQVDAVGIASLLESTGAPAIDLLKVDIERSERVVFAHNTAGWLPRTRNIVIEIHDEECRQAVFGALAGYDYTLLHSGELTIFRGLRPRAAVASAAAPLG